MNDLLHLFKANIKKEKLFQTGDVLLLAVSGGVDSVVLCELCHLAKFRFIIAHCNFQLRGEESKRDERFVKGLAEHYGKEIFLKRFDTEAYALQNKTSIQVAARELRYQWFYELTAELETRERTPVHVLTAHHADDNVETVLMNFFKGTGIAGMRGMLPKTHKITRPLLFAQKQTLIDFAKEQVLSFVEDSSNASDKYSRNYIRHHVVPFIEEIYPGAAGNITANIERFREIELLYTQSIAVHKKNLIEQRGNEVYIAVRKLLKTDPLKTVVFEITKAYGFTAKQAEEVIGLLHAETGKFVLSSTHRILRNRDCLVISSLAQNASSVIVIDKNEKEVMFEKGKLLLTIRERKDEWEIPVAPSVACLDMKEIQFPLLLRKWKPGDYFYPLGMKKKKKLSRFFIDQKLSLPEKENTWVVEMNKKIVWVVNKRIDERFKVLPGTKTILKIALKTAEV
ncbi:tRNA lysidine(34) synthetase TilS [Agriterribacter sp.]|uniref:tRNA lysidine(34) synthetase TilS n=1 Tax=Agriterribacter sp. TaxID=2821509 RepID=UPI002D19D08C|nr:tRNA lysidine(34) synthetase TilS [Agriterribacter sp.]HTN09007.1 tRNA lysidine(34) synthetase TilS [Agriterribacter sp.]